jgi:hypothetical protein
MTASHCSHVHHQERCSQHSHIPNTILDLASMRKMIFLKFVESQFHKAVKWLMMGTLLLRTPKEHFHMKKIVGNISCPIKTLGKLTNGLAQRS